MVEVEILGAPVDFELPSRGASGRPGCAGAPADFELPSRVASERVCRLAAAAAGVHEGHLAIEYVQEGRIRELNLEHRGRDAATDVLSFPIDGADPHPPGMPRELGDVVICPEHTVDLLEAIVHGTLHLVGLDHELDDGEMLALQAELLRWERELDSPRALEAVPPGAGD
jgi:probable rRNA maturation factor